ncbi:MAG: T9SS type A sorting domain-containing protein [Chitinophagales bacterium]|nr:T9SS type A sorting domain-containing protein [Chitinophagales bacterium]
MYILCLLLSVNLRSFAQQPFFPSDSLIFDDQVVSEVQIWIDQQSLDAILSDVHSDVEYPATFVFIHPSFSDTIVDVGFRLRGNTSRVSAKKSWKISMNTFLPGRKFMGLEKLNINGEHNDPTVMRSKLCWDLCREMQIPAPRSNHVALYINGHYRGIHINVEHIDEEFVRSRFGNRSGNLYKCYWGSDLTYIDDNPASYMDKSYELKTNTDENDFSDLAEFIKVLNKSSLSTRACELREVFNVDDYLRSMAMDILTGNWDGPLINKNNFYLYHNSSTDQFEYIPYDLDNTFGIDWLGQDWGTRSVYDWTSDPNRPLFTKLMDIQEFRDLLSYYMDEIISTYFNSSTLDPKIDNTAQMIRPFVAADSFYSKDYGYTITDFDLSLNVGLPGGSFHDDDYGLKSYVSTRSSTASSELVTNPLKTVVHYLDHDFEFDEQRLYITASIWDDVSVSNPKLEYFIDSGSPSTTNLLDDGLHKDGKSGDGRYGNYISLPLDFESISFRITAENSGGPLTVYPCDYKTISYSESPVKLFVNEIMALNETTIADEVGEFDDWIEIYNGGTNPVFLGDKFLTDNKSNRDKWQMPAITIDPGEFLVFWADENGAQGEMHANFKLSSQGEYIGIFDNSESDFAVIDEYFYGPQTTDVSYGYTVDGFGSPEKLPQPTPGRSNNPPESGNIVLYPNPTSGSINIEGASIDRMKLISTDGKLIFDEALSSVSELQLPGAVPNGVYILEIKTSNDQTLQKSIVIMR